MRSDAYNLNAQGAHSAAKALGGELKDQTHYQSGQRLKSYLLHHSFP